MGGRRGTYPCAEASDNEIKSTLAHAGKEIPLEEHEKVLKEKFGENVLANICRVSETALLIDQIKQMSTLLPSARVKTWRAALPSVLQLVLVLE